MLILFKIILWFFLVVVVVSLLIYVFFSLYYGFLKMKLIAIFWKLHLFKLAHTIQIKKLKIQVLLSVYFNYIILMS